MAIRRKKTEAKVSEEERLDLGVHKMETLDKIYHFLNYHMSSRSPYFGSLSWARIMNRSLLPKHSIFRHWHLILACLVRLNTPKLCPDHTTWAIYMAFFESPKF